MTRPRPISVGDFLLERYLEDGWQMQDGPAERLSGPLLEPNAGPYWSHDNSELCIPPVTAFRDLTAKRQIVDYVMSLVFGDDGDVHVDAINAGLRILAHLALPYCDHEDYRPEWRP